MDITINQAINQLLAGKVIGVPTDTVYGLSCLPDYADEIYRVKKRNQGKKIVTMVYDESFFEIDDPILKSRMGAVWPGPVTLIFQQNESMESYRIPNEPNLLNLLSALQLPIYTTSANISGEEPCLTREQFKREFPDIDLLIEEVPSLKTNIASEILVYKNGEFERIR